MKFWLLFIGLFLISCQEKFERMKESQEFKYKSHGIVCESYDKQLNHLKNCVDGSGRKIIAIINPKDITEYE